MVLEMRIKEKVKEKDEKHEEKMIYLKVYNRQMKAKIDCSYFETV